MDIGVILESPQGSQSSSREGSCTCAFLPSCSSSVTLAIASIMGSVAFPRGFPRGFHTRISYRAFNVPPWSESILGVKVEAAQGKQVLWNGLRHQGDSVNGGTTLDLLSPFLWRAPPLEMRWEPREFFPDQTGKDPSSRAMRRKRGSSGCGRDPRASSRVETGKSGNVLSCSKGVKDLLEVPGLRCD